MRRLPVLLLGAVCVLAAAAPAAARPFRLGYFDPKFAYAGRDALFADARGDGAQVVRITVDWSSIAARRPRNAADPGDAAYRWGLLDQQVALARANGERVLASINFAPGWAEGRGRPRGTRPGTWRPDPRALGAFSGAVARRYRGRVEAYQVWNEPNLSEYLNPQWVRRGGRLVVAAPDLYRAMLNAAYGAIKAADPRAPVVTAGTSPYGDPERGAARMPPAIFWRALVSRTVRFDVAAHHPYSFSGPLHHAFSRDDAAIPDVGRIARIVGDGVRRGRVLPRRAKRTWVTEWSWDSSPPDPMGVPAERQARWLEYSLFSFWRQGVDTALWYQVRDEAGPDFRSSFQSGTHFIGGGVKPAARAYRFPFVTAPDGRGRVRLWGRTPRGGTVVVERQVGRGWRRVVALRATSGAVFGRRRVRLARGTVVRARVGGATSLTWRVGREPLA